MWYEDGHSYGNPQSYPSLTEASIDTLVEGLNNNVFSSVDLVRVSAGLDMIAQTTPITTDLVDANMLIASQTYLARIAEVDGYLNAITEINPDALSIAAALDAERKSGKIRGYVYTPRPIISWINQFT